LRASQSVKGIGSVWLLTLSALAIVWLIAFYFVADLGVRWSIVTVGTIFYLVSPGGLICINWLFSPSYRTQWTEYAEAARRRGRPPPADGCMPIGSYRRGLENSGAKYRRGGPVPGGPPAPEPIRVPRKQFDAWVAGAMAAMRELPNISRDAKERVRQTDAPIVQEDLEQILQKLNETQRKINNEMDWTMTDSKEVGDREWDQALYVLLVAPSIAMSNSPKAIVDLTLAAVSNGANKASLLYDLVIAEMDAAVARYYVACNMGIAIKSEARKQSGRE
jgi:hypothetical protein